MVQFAVAGPQPVTSENQYSSVVSPVDAPPSSAVEAASPPVDSEPPVDAVPPLSEQEARLAVIRAASAIAISRCATLCFIALSFFL